VALAFSAESLLAWWNQPGEWLLMIATGISLVLLWLDIRDSQEQSAQDADTAIAPGERELLG
jgi:hypothetical protein